MKPAGPAPRRREPRSLGIKPKARRSAFHHRDVKPAGGRRIIAHHTPAFRHDHGGFRQIRIRQRQAQDFSARRILFGEQIQRRILAELDHLDPVLEPRELMPRPGGVAQVMGEVAAVAVGDRGQEPLAVLARGEFNLRDARKIAAQLIRVGADRRAEFVKPDLLVKMQVALRPLAGVADNACKKCPCRRHSTRRCRRRSDTERRE